MKEIFNKHLNKLANPLLFYIDKNGNSVFKNFCMLASDGNQYNKIIQIKDAGEALEYRISLDKRLKIYTILLTILIYLLFIHVMYNIKGLLFCELLWIICYFAARMFCSEIYGKKLKSLYGEYIITDFNPNIKPQKKESFKRDFISKVWIIIICIILLMLPAFLFQKLIKISLNGTHPKYKNAEIISDIYTLVYPQNSYIMETRALSEYVSGNFSKASEYYIKAVELLGKNFTQKDYTKFANLLYLIKKSDGSQAALDKFNELSTNMHLSTEEQIKLLWIKSIFSISNNVSDFVVQDYDDMLLSLNKKNKTDEFYITSDKAYMLYLLGNYEQAVALYNSLIEYAKYHKKLNNEISRLYVERGFAKRQTGNYIGADDDFSKSGINMYDIGKYEPKLPEQAFVFDKL